MIILFNNFVCCRCSVAQINNDSYAKHFEYSIWIIKISLEPLFAFI